MRKVNRLLAVSLVMAMLMAIVPFGMFNTFAVASDANLLSGKTPVISGSGVGYWDEANDGVSYRADLTDNTISEGFNWTGNEWFGLYYGTDTAGINAPDRIGTISFDLGGEYSLTKLAVHLWNSDDATSGIAAPASITAYVSADNGSTYTKLDNTFVFSAEVGVAYWSSVDLTNVTATNVKFEIQLQNSFVMLDEVQAFGTETVENTDTVESSLLLGKQPVISGNGVGYADDVISYRANLTDGSTANGMNWIDNEWFGFYYGDNAAMLNTVNGVGTATIALDGAYSLNRVAVHVFAGDTASGISAPIINAYYSMDNGVSYLPMRGQFVAAAADGSAFWAEMALADTKATHIKFEFISQSGTFVMIDEIEAYGESTIITEDEIVEGGATVEDKESLRLAMETAKNISYKDYSATALENIRNSYDEAVEMMASATVTKAECDAKAQELNDLLKVKANILSIGKSYTTTAPYRNDQWDDDGIRLTDGKKCVFDGGEYAYSGWREEAFIRIDLGEEMESDTYSMYLAAGTWGIALPMPNSFKIEVLYSNDDVNYTSLGVINELEHTGGATAYSDAENAIWGTFFASLELDTPITARYIKFNITNEECVGFIWTDEAEVSLGETSLSGGVYVTEINKIVENGECIVFTPEYNGGVIGVDDGISWTTNVLAKWNAEANTYIVTGITHGTGSNTPSVTLADDEILIAAHAWDGEVENPVVGSGNNVKQVYNARVGDIVELNGIDLESNYCTVAPYIEFSAAGEVQKIEYYHTDVRDATCTEGSYCAACGNTLSDPLGHRDVDDATCTVGDYCNDCDTELSDALGHDEGEWETLDDGSQELRCTRCGTLLDSKAAPEKDTHIYYGLRGDINFNDKIDARDYLLLKRGYFGTYFLDEGATYRADINENGKVDARDYLLLKRAYFNTYEIPNPYVYIEIVEE